MGRKDRLWQHINEMIALWGSDEYHIMPTTYVLPRDVKKLKAYLHGNPPHIVILKPVYFAEFYIFLIHLFCLIFKQILNAGITMFLLYWINSILASLWPFI